MQEIPLNMEQLEDEELHDQAASWLAKALSDKKLSVQRAVLFGSIVHDHYQTSDVDVIIVSQTVSDRKAVRIGRKIKTDLRQQFYRRFGHPLHVQLYHANESLRLSRFLECLGKYEELPLNGNQ